jgi:preprotein translocase YajC subunit
MNIIAITPIIQVSLPGVVIGFAFYFIIYLPQKNDSLTTTLVTKRLFPGIKVTTATGTQGTVIYVLPNTVIIQTNSGQKIEILKQIITTIQP